MKEMYKPSLQEEIASLRHQIGGFKTSNAAYRRKIGYLKERVEHYKSLDIEGDELYERKISECEDLKVQLDSAQLTIQQLHGQIASYNSQILDYNERIEDLNNVISELREEIERRNAPWWKRMFA